MRGVEERLDPEAVADREHRAVTAVGDHGRELAAQVAPQVHALAQVEVQRDLAVGFGLERAALCAQAIADRAVAVELAVHDDPDVAGRVGDRLVAVIQADDREARVAEEPAPVGRDPTADAVGAPVMERLERAVEALGLHGVAERPGYESANGRLPSGRGPAPARSGSSCPISEGGCEAIHAWVVTSGRRVVMWFPPPRLRPIQPRRHGAHHRTGLGLAIVDTLAQRNHGTVTAQTVPPAAPR